MVQGSKNSFEKTFEIVLENLLLLKKLKRSWAFSTVLLKFVGSKSAKTNEKSSSKCARSHVFFPTS